MRQNYFLTLAKKASKRSDHHSHKIGCVITKKNRVLGIGHNLMKTHPKSPHSHKSIHAEYMAFLNSYKDIKGSTVYIFREQKNGNWASSRPCKDCWKFLMECGVKEVVYSFEGSYAQERM